MDTFTEDLANNYFKRNQKFSANKITKKSPDASIEQLESDVEELIKAYHELFTRIEEIEKKQKKQEKRNKHIVYRSYG